MNNEVDVITNKELSVQEHIWNQLGFPGTMLSGSKIGYNESNPGHEVFFNACLFVDKQQVWYGDVDLTKRAEALQDLANVIGEFYLTCEMPFRFEGFDEGMKRSPDRVRKFTPAPLDGRTA